MPQESVKAGLYVAGTLALGAFILVANSVQESIHPQEQGVEFLGFWDLTLLGLPDNSLKYALNI